MGESLAMIMKTTFSIVYNMGESLAMMIKITFYKKKIHNACLRISSFLTQKPNCIDHT